MGAEKKIEISLGLSFLGALAEKSSGVLKRLGDWESAIYLPQDKRDARQIDRPIYICGLARSGSTILLELLASHPDVFSHRYRDFPFLLTPVWWQQFYDRGVSRKEIAVERAHKDRIMVTPESPEAMEEILWMHFFHGLHDPGKVSVLRSTDSHEAFEKFYREHILKVLQATDRKRYLAKGNYNLTRLGYIRKMFPDARFIIPVRQPEAHITSLMKQHRLFSEEEKRDPRILKHMQRTGHFEFGLNRQVVNVGDGVAREVESLWSEGEEVRGWARYWASLYGFVLETLQSDKDLQDATLIVPYEPLCTDSLNILKRLYAHVELSLSESELQKQAGRLRLPDYYQPSLSEAEQEVVHEETEAVVLAMAKSSVFLYT